MDNGKTKPASCSYVDGIASSQAIDTTGEIVDLAGIDCSSLVGGALNWEHKSDIPAQIVGKILEYKKIFSEKDCENDRHKRYWDKCKTPYLYVMGRLFDDKKDSSKECAALFIDDAEHPDEPPMVGFSIEGSRVNKSGIIVDKSIARKLTITGAAANKTCVAELIPAESAKTDPDSIFKSEPSFTIELLGKSEQLVKAPVPGSSYPSADQAKPTPKPSMAGLKYGPIESKPKNLGKEIGKTKSGKSIMSHAKPTDYKGFNAQEHQEAANIHMKYAEEGKGVPGASHFDTAKRHMAIAGRGERQGAKAQAARQQAVKKSENVPLKKDDMSAPPPEPNKANAAAMQAGALSGATSASQAWTNIKSGLGFGKKEKPKKELKKALAAGSGMAGPGNLVQGAALGKESVDKKMKKSEWLARAEQEYKTWSKREEFESFMAKSMPHLTKYEIIALGQTLALNKSLKNEKKLKKMMPPRANLNSFVEKKEKK
jgi:hypothetical protein